MATPAEVLSKLWHSLVDNRRTMCPDISLFSLKCNMALVLAQSDSSDRPFDEKLLLGYASLEPTSFEDTSSLLGLGELKESRPTYPESKPDTPDSVWWAYHDSVSKWDDQLSDRMQKLLSKLVSEGALFVDSRGAYTTSQCS